MIESILREFIKEASLLENIVEGTVYSTSPLTKEEIKSLEVALEKKDGYKTKLINKIDPSLIGGIKIVINDKIIDRSMKSALDDIKKKILEGENS
jgi:F-type H+-transporting ATPase subunit delta